MNSCVRKFLVDTGSNATLMARTLFDHIFPECDIDTNERAQIGITGYKIDEGGLC